MTIHADLVLRLHRARGSATKIHDRSVAGPWLPAIRVVTARTMTGFALQLRHWRFGIGLLTVRRAENDLHGRVVVASQAGIGSALSQRGFSFGRMILCPNKREQAAQNCEHE